MKKLLLYLTLLLFICFVAPSYSDALMQIGPAGADYCDACPDASAGADLLCEEFRFDDADALCDWTIVEAGGATGEVNLADACDNIDALGCTDIPMTYCASIVKTNTTLGDVYAYKQVSETGLVEIYAQFYLKVIVPGLPNDYGDWAVFKFNSGTNLVSVYVGYYRTNSTTYNISAHYHTAAGWQPALVSGSAITVDGTNWYGIRIHVHDDASANADSIEWWVDYNLDSIYTAQTGVTGKEFDRGAIKYIDIGDSEMTKVGNYQLTGMKVDDDAMPVDCARLTPYCASSPDAGGGADVLCEYPDGTSDGLGGWTISETGGATGDVNFESACDNIPALGCTDISTNKCVSFIKTNTTAGANLYAYKAISSATSDYLQVYIKVISEGMADGGQIEIASVGTTANADSAALYMYQTDSTLYFRMGYHVAAGWTFDTGGTAVAVDTWYGLRLKVLDPAGGGSDSVQWWVDYPNNGTWTDEGTAGNLTLDRAIGRARLGDDDTNIVRSMIITGYKLDDDTMPTACLR